MLKTVVRKAVSFFTKNLRGILQRRTRNVLMLEEYGNREDLAMRQLQFDPVEITYEFMRAFGRSLRFLFFASGHVLLGIILFSILAPSEVLLDAVVDGSILQVLLYVPFVMVAFALVGATLSVVTDLLVYVYRSAELEKLRPILALGLVRQEVLGIRTHHRAS